MKHLPYLKPGKDTPYSGQHRVATPERDIEASSTYNERRGISWAECQVWERLEKSVFSVLLIKAIS